jgi:predicted enzyme related to lactoylglutathione lyase
MSPRLVHLVLDANDPLKLARFWAAALSWEIEEEDGEIGVCPAGYDYPDPMTLPVLFEPVREAKTGKNRVHLDLATQSAEHHAALVARLSSLGAQPADVGQGDVPWAVLADPEGNEFCVLEPRPVYRDTGPVAAVVVDCVNPAGLAAFWELASGWARVRSNDGLVTFRSPQGVGPYLELEKVAEAKTVKNRMHLDVAPYQDEDHAAAVKQLQEAGAVPADIGQGSDVSWVVLADPEGSEFCVLTPR